MKSYKEWQDNINEIAPEEGGIDWRYLYRVMGQRGEVDPAVATQINTLAKRMRLMPKYKDNPDALIAAIINAAIYVGREEVTSRNWSAGALGNILNRADRLAHSIAGEEE